jgi:hypothetical protein
MFMHITKFICALFLLLFISGCGGDDLIVIEPKCEDLVECNLVFDNSFLNLCTDFFEPKRTLVVEVAVSGAQLDANGNPAVSTFNADQPGDLPNTNFGRILVPIKIPRCGSFQIDITVRGEDKSCFSCCGKMPVVPTSGIPACPANPATGAPIFRAKQIMINSSISAPPAAEINVTPQFTGCKCCK